jgi:DNA/RNA endonuclease YhcR with UshA esterase domain
MLCKNKKRAGLSRKSKRNNKRMIPLPRLLAFSIISHAALLSSAIAQTTTIIPANEAAAHIGEYATVEGVVAKVFTSNKGNTFLNIGASYPNQTFTGWIPPASPVNKSPILSGIEGKHVKITGRIEIYKGKPEIRINAASQLEIE